MKVAMISVKVVEGPVDEVVDMVAVRDGGMAAARVVLRRTLHGCTGGRSAPVHLQNVFRDTRAAG